MLVCQPRVDARQKDLALEVSRSIPCFPFPQLPRLITAGVSPFELIGGGSPVYTKEKPDMPIPLFPLLVRTYNKLYYKHKNVAKTSKKPRKMNRNLNNRNPRGPALLTTTIMMVMNTYRAGIKTGACLILLSNNNDKKRKLAAAYIAFTVCQTLF